MKNPIHLRSIKHALRIASKSSFFDLALLSLIVAGVTATAVWWAATETRPPHYDMARHLWESLLYWKLFENHSLLPILQEYHYYPPFVYWIVLPFYKLFGTTLVAAVASNTVFIATLTASTYFIGRKLGGRVVGLTAAVLINTYPIITTQFKEFQLDAPLTAMVALALCLLIYSEAFSKRYYTLGFGVACGLGMLTKWTFIACIALPVIYTLILAVAADVKRRRPDRTASVVIAGLIAYALCSPWYAANIQQFRIDMHANGAAQALAEGDPAVGTLTSATWYLHALTTFQVFLPGLLLFIISLAFIAYKRDRRNDYYLLGLFLIGMYLIFTQLPNKDVRYTMPMLIGVAALSAAGIQYLSPRIKKVAAGIIIAVSILGFTIISFGAPGLPSTIVIGSGTNSVTVFAQRGYIIGAPTHEQWMLQTVMNYVACQPIAKRSISYQGDESIWLNGWDLSYYTLQQNIQLKGPKQAEYNLIRSVGMPTESKAPLMRTKLPDATILSLYKQ